MAAEMGEDAIILGFKEGMRLTMTDDSSRRFSAGGNRRLKPANEMAVQFYVSDIRCAYSDELESRAQRPHIGALCRGAARRDAVLFGAARALRRGHAACAACATRARSANAGHIQRQCTHATTAPCPFVPPLFFPQ